METCDDGNGLNHKINGRRMVSTAQEDAASVERM